MNDSGLRRWTVPKGRLKVAQHASAGITFSRKGKVPLGTTENHERGKGMIQPSLAGLAYFGKDNPALAPARRSVLGYSQASLRDSLDPRHHPL